MNSTHLTKSQINEIAVAVYEFNPQVYFLLHDSEIVYVGSSGNAQLRIKNHFNSNKLFDSYAIIDCCPDHVLAVEYFYIQKFKPKYNKKLKPRKSEIYQPSIVELDYV